MRLLLVMVALVAAVPAKAFFEDGNSLLTNCTSDAKSMRGVCVGYVIGVADAMELSLCIPARVTQGQVQDVVLNYLTANPASRHKAGMILVGEALRKAFPCPKSR